MKDLAAYRFIGKPYQKNTQVSILMNILFETKILQKIESSFFSPKPKIGIVLVHIHKLSTDEVFHFYLGDPVELFELHPESESSHTVLGPDILNGQKVKYVVNRGNW